MGRRSRPTPRTIRSISPRLHGCPRPAGASWVTARKMPRCRRSAPRPSCPPPSGASRPRHWHTESLLASGVRTYMVVPMSVGSELIGAVSFGGASSAFSADQVSIAQELAAQLAIALAQARLLERVQRQAEELERRV